MSTLQNMQAMQDVGTGALIPGTMFDINAEAFEIIAGHNPEATPESVNGHFDMAAVHGSGDSSSGGSGGSASSSGSSGGGSSSGGGGGSSIPTSSVGNLQPSSTPSGGASLFSGMGAGGGLFGSV